MCCNNNNSQPINNNWRERAAQRVAPAREQARSPQTTTPINFQHQQQMILQRQQELQKVHNMRLQRKTYR